MLESRRVVVRCCVRWLLAGTAVTWSALASALGLGEITLHSALNQPLRADIALLDVAGLEEGDLSVSLASVEEFSRAGVERVFFLNDLKFTPVLRGNRNLIQVTSSKPVNEPFLNFLVQLKQPNGRLLREYTVLIDLPGTPGIVPASDEPLASRPESAFPSVQPAVAPVPAPKDPLPKPAAAAAPDPLAEQLATSVLQNQQLQATVDELNAKLQAQDEHIAREKKQLTDLQAQMAEIKQAPTEPVAPETVAPAPVVVEESGPNGLLIGGLLVLVLGLLAAWIRRQRQQAQGMFEPAEGQPSPPEPSGSRTTEAALQPTHAHHEVAPVSDALEAVAIYLTYGRYAEAADLLREAMAKAPQQTDLAVQLLEVLGKQGDVAGYEAQENSLRTAGFDAQRLQDIRARHPKLSAVAPVALAPTVIPPMTPDPTPTDEFQLNLDDLSMDARWDLIEPLEHSPSTSHPSSEPVLPDPEIEWEIEPASRSLDDSFLHELSEPGPSLELEPLSLEPTEPNNAGKLERAQTCIDDGDLDSAIELLNELLKEADEQMKQTARNLLAGIR
ncbi:FimV/HubP family polar landmark protein [Pseudomonas sp. C2B4]|uniref:FimV/HubP family polar landmark protein n=1 Tax=Pseudomonas sp. C2B4 TaxID=2735270 RepID=UPI001585E98B|nr:FimV/HubP family polar landmark protein [Pseudomonas sp. C2B4]NUU35743.1 peptidoglycan-binding protein LysM [Pseudomonas sp. C2B4]